MVEIYVRKREKIPKWFNIGLPTIATTTSLFLSFLTLVLFGLDFFMAVHEGLVHPLTTSYGWIHIILKTITLLLCTLGLIIAFKAGVWNIGAEGQILIGATMATWIALFVMPSGNPIMTITLMYLFGFIGGALWAFIPGVLKAKFDVNEVLTTIMMNYIAFGIVSYLIVGPWRGKRVYGYETTDVFPENARLPVISKKIPIPYTSLILAISLTILVYYLLYRTKIGLEIRTVGANPQAARACGIPYDRTIVIAIMLSGGLAGLAGVNEVAGVHYQMRFPPSQISGGYGFTSILVAFLARLDPLVAPVASILIAMIIICGYSLQASFGVRKLVVNLFTGIFLASLACAEVLYRYSIQIKFRGFRSLRKTMSRVRRFLGGCLRWLARWR